MNANFHLNLFHTINGLTETTGLSVVPAARAVNLPQQVATDHFGPDGATLAAQSTTGFSGVTLGPDGVINGGVLQHATTAPGGAPINASAVNFGATGMPAHVATAIHDRFSPGTIYEHVTADMSGCAWTPSATIHAGQVAVATHDAASGAIRSAGQIRFDQETILGGSFSFALSPKDNAIARTIEIDYSGVQKLGHDFQGGTCQIEHRDGKGGTLSRSALELAADGTVTKVTSDILDPQSGALRKHVITDMTGVRCDARGKIHEGSMVVTVNDPVGQLQSQANTSFTNSQPTKTVTRRYRKAKLSYSVETDFSAARFDHDLSVVSSQTTSTVYNAAGKVVTVTVAQFDAQGNLAQRTTKSMDPTSGKATSSTHVDYSTAEYAFTGRRIGGFATITRSPATGADVVTRQDFAAPTGVATTPLIAAPPPVAPPTPTYPTKQESTRDASGKEVSRTTTISRADGTMLQQIVTAIVSDKPTTSTITQFAPDGRTIVSTHIVDASALTLDPATGKVSGAAKVTAKVGTTVLRSSSVVHY